MSEKRQNWYLAFFLALFLGLLFLAGERAEGAGLRDVALKHYKEALGSYMDDWFEYEFALERIRRLKIAKTGGQ